MTRSAMSRFPSRGGKPHQPIRLRSLLHGGKSRPLRTLVDAAGWITSKQAGAWMVVPNACCVAGVLLLRLRPVAFGPCSTMSRLLKDLANGYTPT